MAVKRLVAQHGQRWSTISQILKTRGVHRNVASCRNHFLRHVKGASSATERKNVCRTCGQPKLGHVCPASFREPELRVLTSRDEHNDLASLATVAAEVLAAPLHSIHTGGSPRTNPPTTHDNAPQTQNIADAPSLPLEVPKKKCRVSDMLIYYGDFEIGRLSKEGGVRIPVQVCERGTGMKVVLSFAVRVALIYDDERPVLSSDGHPIAPLQEITLIHGGGELSFTLPHVQPPSFSHHDQQRFRIQIEACVADCPQYPLIPAVTDAFEIKKRAHTPPASMPAPPVPPSMPSPSAPAAFEGRMPDVPSAHPVRVTPQTELATPIAEGDTAACDLEIAITSRLPHERDLALAREQELALALTSFSRCELLLTLT